jgi:pimeloyl-ACP methyl ester carboxylesterase
MITGSGPQNRDEELFGFKLFGVIADSLTREGVAVLRYDDRGVGGSTGNVSESTSEDFAGDVLAAVGLLKARPEIDGTQIGLIGHSEGGVVAPLVADRSSDVAFMILLAGTALPGEEILFAQGELIMRANGATDEQLAANRYVQEQIFHAIRTDSGWDDVRATLDEQIRASLDALPAQQRETIADPDAYVQTQVEGQIQQSQSKWLRYFIDYDPAPALARIKTPVLALFGELDLQVPAKANRQRMEEVFASSNHPNYRIEVLPRANHLFLTAQTGSPGEYATMKKEFVPELMPLMISWIHEQAGSTGGH